MQANFCHSKSVFDVKAAYLYNFIKFISWPSIESASTTDNQINKASVFNLCLLGEDPSYKKLSLLDKRPIHGHTLTIKSIPKFSPSDDCKVLYIGASEERFLNNILPRIHSTPILTLSSIPNFANLGGTIGFITLGNVVRFNINLKQAEATQLSISSKLLELANKVVR